MHTALIKQHQTCANIGHWYHQMDVKFHFPNNYNCLVKQQPQGKQAFRRYDNVVRSALRLKPQ